MKTTIGWAIISKEKENIVPNFARDNCFHIYPTRKNARKRCLKHEKIIKVMISVQPVNGNDSYPHYYLGGPLRDLLYKVNNSEARPSFLSVSEKVWVTSTHENQRSLIASKYCVATTQDKALELEQSIKATKF
jgi:hypothetical protein